MVHFRKIGTVSIIVFLLLVGVPVSAQVIDFEEDFWREGDVVADQYAEGDCGVRFYIDSVGSPRRPMIARVGRGASGFSAAFNGPSRTEPLCGITTPQYYDMPAAGQDVGCQFLTDNEIIGSHPTSLHILANNHVLKASGAMLDIDGYEQWTVTAYDGAKKVGTSVVLDAGDPGAGDGVAYYWTLDFGIPFDRIEIRYTGTSPNVGLAFDNFTVCETPNNGCIDFDEDDALDDWYEYSVSRIEIAPIDGRGGVLHLIDGAGGSAAVNNVDFGGNWLERSIDGCMCFDYKVVWDTPSGSDAQRAPKLQIYTGDPVTTDLEAIRALRAFPVGHMTSPQVTNDEWRTYCLPVELCTDGKLPSNEYGTWRILNRNGELKGDEACEAWNLIIQNVTGISLQTDYNSVPSEHVYYDNFCWSCDRLDPCEDTLRVSVDSVTTNTFGKVVSVPVRIDHLPRGVALEHIAFTVRYGNRSISLLDTTPEQMAVQFYKTLLKGWTIEEMEILDSGTVEEGVRLTLTAPQGEKLAEEGVICVLRFSTFLSIVDAVTLEEQLLTNIPMPLEFHADTVHPCIATIAKAGYIGLQLCGLQERLIESSGSKYNLTNKPNPFNPSTQIEFTLGLDGPTALVVYDVNGQLVEQLVSEYLDAGAYSIIWDASDYPSGLYYCRMTSGHWSAVREMVVVK